MTMMMSIPDANHFERLIEQHENRYKETDRIYLNAIQDFKRLIPNNFGDHKVKSILNLYLLKWGKMSRWLGYRGCERISEKLGQMESQFSEFHRLTLLEIDLNQMANRIESLYDELLNTTWKSEKGKVKRVAPTSTAKVLHLVAPDLFMIWDSRIRKVYGFKNSGKEYVRFLDNMQNWLKNLSPIVEKWQRVYGKSSTKIIDDYNWITCWG